MFRFSFSNMTCLIAIASLAACRGSAVTPQTVPMTANDRQSSLSQEIPLVGSTKLLALYSFNGTLADSSGNGRTAHDSGTPVYATGAPFGGKAISFSGTGSAIVTAPLNISVTGLRQVTFGGWFKALSVATPNYGVVSNDDGDYDRSIDIDGRPTGFATWSAFVGGTVVGKVRVVVGKWYFVAVSFNQATLPGHYAFYVNNGTTTTTQTGIDNFDTNSVTTRVTIGRNPNFDHPYKGQAANVFFEHLILTPAQINSVILHGPSMLPR